MYEFTTTDRRRESEGGGDGGRENGGRERENERLRIMTRVTMKKRQENVRVHYHKTMNE